MSCLTLNMPYFSSFGWFWDLLTCSKVWVRKVTRVTLRSDQQGDTQKKTSELEKLRTFRTLFLTNGQSKLGSWVLLSSVRVAKKVHSPRSKNIRHKTSDLRPSYLFYIQYVSHPSTYVGFNTYILNFYLRPIVNYSNECHFLLKSSTSVGI
jgi:hypothetical protein